MKKNVVILGGGIMGISAAHVLLNETTCNYNVTVVSEFYTPGTTSDKSVGLWGPYLPGVDTKTKEYQTLLRWGNETKKELWRLMREGMFNEYGIYVCQNWLISSSHEFPPDACAYKEIVDDCLVYQNINFGHYNSALRYTSPQIIPTRYLRHLTQQVEKLGARLLRERIENIEEFCKNYDGKIDIIVNCLGLGSKTVFNDDSLTPIRGVLVKYPPITKYLLMAYECLESVGDEITYIMFRPDCTLLGGTAIIGDWTKQNKPEEIKSIIDRCTKLIPEIADYEMLSDWSGLRPGRPMVRLEMDTRLIPNIPVIHNYGHGGAGWSLHHGCSKDIMSLINDYFGKNEKQSKL